MECDSFFFSEQDDVFFNKIDEDLDFALALSLQEELNDVSKQNVQLIEAPSKSTSRPLGIVDAQWELIDPHPDIHGLFLEFNRKYFSGRLEGVEVKWSPKMTLCAGVCCYEGSGGLCSVRLSLPLLKLRPRRDLVETLLHEMIHAYLFVTANNKDHNAHGPEFLKHMYRINNETGTRISVYHSFNDEVDMYRKHWWKCNGPCQKKSPFYGIVKRAKNRPPSSNDNWWSAHQSTCGGTFIKIKEPDDYKQKSQKRKTSQESKDKNSSANITNFFKPNSDSDAKRRKGEADIHTIKNIFAKEDNMLSVFTGGSDTSQRNHSLLEHNNPAPFSGKGFTLGASSSNEPKSLLSRIRKEFGHPKPSDSQRSLSLVTTKPSTSFSNKNDSIKEITSGLSTTGKFSNNSEKNRLVQSSLEQFVMSPSRSFKDDKPMLCPGGPADGNNINRVPCPVCASFFPNNEINIHLDECLLTAAQL